MQGKDEKMPNTKESDIVEAVHADEKTFFTNLFDENGIETVLDCGCGTGEFLYLFHKMNRKVLGCDPSESLLHIAKACLLEQGINLPLMQCEMKRLSSCYPQKVDLITCINNKLSHIQTSKELLQVFKEMYECLNEDGMVVLSTSTTYGAISLVPFRQTVIKQKDFCREMVKELQVNHMVFHIIDYFKEGEPGKETATISYKILMDDHYETLLKEAGFHDIEIYEDYNYEPFVKESSPKIVVVARK